MGDIGNDPERRKEGLEEGLDKAKQGAQKLAGWFTRKLGDAAEQIKESEPVREKIEQFEKHQSERAHDKLTGALIGIYDDWRLKLQEILEGLDQEVAKLGKSIESLNFNINELRLRSVSEQDDEMREYQGQVAGLRSEQHELEASREPFQDEIERMLRQRRAALARLDADPEQLAVLQEDARRQVAESKERLESLPDKLAEQRAADDDVTT